MKGFRHIYSIMMMQCRWFLLQQKTMKIAGESVNRKRLVWPLSWTSRPLHAIYTYFLILEVQWQIYVLASILQYVTPTAYHYFLYCKVLSADFWLYKLFESSLCSCKGVTCGCKWFSLICGLYCLLEHFRLLKQNFSSFADAIKAWKLYRNFCNVLYINQSLIIPFLIFYTNPTASKWICWYKPHKLQ